MRIEDRQIDGPELERAQDLRATELDEGNDHAVNDHGTELETERRSLVLGAMKAIFAGNHLALEGLKLPARELAALDALKEAVEGRDSALAQYMYATDRSDLLEQALAVLQPNIAELPASFKAVIERVSGLRKDLRALGDAQDELLTGHDELAKTKAKPEDSDAKPEDDVKPASTLVGPERPEPEKLPSTLAGPDVPEPKKQPSTLGGPELPEPPKSASTAYDASDDQSTPSPPSVTDDKTTKKPWWRRPFG